MVCDNKTNNFVYVKHITWNFQVTKYNNKTDHDNF